jgi:hypothetical protein
MKLKLSALALGLLATAAIVIGALGPATSAAADPETDSADIDIAIKTGDFTRLPTWLRHSIIVCAADTMHARVATVKAGLRAGHSLSEIAARFGVREPALERGILNCERTYLWRLVGTDKLNRAEFYRLMYFLTTHIDRIVNYHYNPSDPVLSDAVTDVAVTDVPVTD